MMSYVKNYLSALNLTTADTILCEVCGNVGQEIHHVQHRQKNNPALDQASNLICLCVKCHIEAHKHNSYENKQKLFDIIKSRSE